MKRNIPLSKKIGVFLCVLAVMLVGATNVIGATRYSVATGNWNATSTWSATSGGTSGASARVAGDIVFIEGNRTVTTTATAACANVSIASGSTLSVGAFNITITGTTTVSGTIIYTSTSGTKTMGTVVISGGTWTSNAAETYGITGLTLSGSTINGTSTGVFNVGAGGFTVSGSTINASGRATITVTGTSTINGSLSFSIATGTKTFTGAISIASGGSFSTGNSAIVFGNNFSNGGTFTAGSSAITITGTLAQSIVGFTTSGTVACTKTSGTATFTGNVSGGAFSKSGAGTLDLGSGFTHTFTGAWTRTAGAINGNSSTLNIGGTVTNTGGTFTAGTSTVNYTGGTQTIANVTYNDLILSGTSAKTIPAGTSISGNLSIRPGGAGTATASIAAGQNILVGSLTLGGIDRACGTWGSTSSGATNKDNTYFAATTGDLTVGTIPSAPSVGTITQPTCAIATGSVVLSGLPSGIWTINPGSISGSGSSTTISGLVAGTYNFTVTNSGGCISPASGNVVINAQPATPTAPTVGTITQPTCGTATATVALSGLPISAWTVIASPGGATLNGSTATANFPGLPANTTYTFTVTLTSSGCTSTASGTAIVNAQPITPSAPTVGSITQPTCGTATATVALSGLPTSAWTVTASPGGATLNGSTATANFSGLAANTNYTFTVTLTSSGCTSVASGLAVVNAQPVTPAAPTIGTITQPTCAVETGSVVLSDLPSTGTWTLTRTPGGITTNGTGTSTIISGLSSGTYTYTVANEDNSTSCPGSGTGLTAEYFNNMTLTAPAALVRTDATVDFDWGTGSPDGVIGNDNFSVRWTGKVQACYSENYTFSTNSDDGIRLFVNGSEIITNWTIHGSTINTSAPIGLVAGQKYDIVLEFFENGGEAVAELSWSSASQPIQIIPQSQLYSEATGCISPASANVVINAQPVTPSPLTVGTITQPTCGTATATVALSGLPTSAWTVTASPGGATLNGSTATANFSGLAASTNYTFTVTLTSSGCTSVASGTAIVNAQPITPSAPTVGTITQPTCETATASVALSGLPTSAWIVTASPGGATLSGSTATANFSGLAANTNYTFTVTLTSSGCTSVASGTAVINAQPATPIAPTATTPQFFCTGSSPTIASLMATGTGIQWYAASSGGSALAPSVTLVNGSHYYATQTVGGCESAERFDVTVTVNPDLPASVNISASATTICSGTSVTYTATPTNGGASPIYQWRVNGIDAGTNSTTYSYTPTNNDAVTCVLTSNATCATGSPANSNQINMVVYPVSVGGTITGVSSPICLGSSTGNLTLTGYTGNILYWERNINSGGWANAGNTGNAIFSESPYSTGTWQYRAVVQSGSCALDYSSVASILIDATTTVGYLGGGTTPICEGASLGTLTLGASTGNILRWEKRLNSGTWINISNTANTYSEVPSSGGTWEYRALVQSGSCNSIYSNEFTITVNPTLTITLGANPSICSGTTTAQLSYSATTGNPSAYSIDFDGTANTAGIGDITGWGLPASPISINVPWNIAPGVYHGVLSVATTYPVCSSVGYPISITVGATPAAAGPISGSSGVTIYQTDVAYSIQDLVGATSYVWAYSGTGATINGSGSSVTIDFSGTASSGDLTVYGTSSCGTGIVSSNFPITVNQPSACAYDDNSLNGAVFTPCINMSSSPETVSSSFAAHQYFLMNVIKGLSYQVYTCNTPDEALKMSVYEEGNASGAAIASSVTNTGNPCNSNSNNVYLSFVSPFSGQVRVLINRANDCTSITPDNLTVNVNVAGGSNTEDSEAIAGTDTWIGHIYDGTDFNNFLGYYNIGAETFQEGFGTAGTWPNNNNDDVTCFNVYSNGTVRGYVKDVSFSVRYLMNSTKKGLYLADMTGDDGNRLFVDGSPVYSDWSNHSPRTFSNVLIPLTGSSSLSFEYYENGGQNLTGFNNLVQVIGNNLSTNVSQSVCLGSYGNAISGDVFGSLPTGISLSGAGYQWAYSTVSSAGPWTDISGATSSTYTPTSSVAPFNSAGIYYLIRKAVLSSANNVSPNPFIATSVSNVATFTVNSLPTLSITNPSSVCAPTTVDLTQSSVTSGSTSGLTFTYWTDAGATLALATPSAVTTSGTYYIKGTTAAGCYSIQPVIVVVHPLLSISHDSPAQLCQYASQMVTATVSGGSGNYSYLWEVVTPGSSNLFIPGSVTNDFIWISGYTVLPGTYNFKVTVTDQTTLCQKVENISTEIMPNISPNWALHPSSVCDGQTGVNYSVQTLAGANYVWSVTGGTISSGQGTSQISVDWDLAAASGNVTVNASIGSCTQELNQSVTINTLPATPTISAGGATTFCDGGSVILTSSAGTGYLWSTGETTSSINVTSAGSYTVQVNNASGCRSASSAPIVVIINPLPSTPTITAGGPTTFCEGGSVTLTSSAESGYLWSTGETTSSINVTSTGSYTVRVTDANGCQSPVSAATIVTVNTLPTVTAASVSPVISCGSASVTLTASASSGTIKWYDAASGGTEITDLNPTINSTTTYYAEAVNNGCSSLVRSAVTAIVNSVPTINLNGTNETCPANNDGTITASISGGLSNIQYIKLTQKFVSPEGYQQIEEIQAFEVFTGNNVALSPGTVASSSSTYQNNVSGFGPQKVNDDITTGYNFWHSFSPNVGEWVMVDLGSGKNIDYLRIFNREDCCWQRGQNMLLELFDASNNIVYSKTVDLWAGVNGAHNIVENVFDLAWNDSGTTLNRTGLDAGTYSLDYTDAVGCTATSSATIGTSNSVSVAPSSISGTTSVCSGESTTLSVSGGSLGAGAAWNWYSGSCGGTYIGTGSSVTVSPAINTDYYVRAEGTCNNTACAVATVTVNPNLPVSISIGASANPVCAGTSVTFTATPANGGATPSYQWKVNGINAGSNSSTFTYTPSSGEAITCELTSNATCATGNPAISNTVTMTVNPNLPVSVSIGASANPVCAGTSVTFTATPNNGGITPSYQWKVNGINSGSNSSTFTYTPSSGEEITCELTSNATCATGSPATSNVITMVVNDLVVPTFIDSPGAETCAFDEVVYTTQSGMSDYVWNIPGILGSDYTIISGGTGSSDYTVTLKWITDTVKTVTVSYTDGNGCAVAPATSTVTVHPIPEIGSFN